MSTIALGTPTYRTPARNRAHDAATAAAPRLRITRRGRAVLGALLVGPVAVALAVSALSGAPAQAGSTSSTASFEYLTVGPGESLWELAGWIAPDADPREVVTQLVALNQLPSADVQPGQRIAIPVQYSTGG